MASINSIPAFPSDIDRDAFGYWLSGFVDGEAHFGLSADQAEKRHHARVWFILQLRADDTSILDLVRSYWQCGTLAYYGRGYRSGVSQVSPGTKSNPVMRYSVANSLHLTSILIPHFARYPLRAKKRLDYAIWARGAHLVSTVARRPRRNHQGRVMPRWKPEEYAEFLQLCTAIKQQRSYNSDSVTVTPSASIVEPSLFDGEMFGSMT